MTRSKNITKEEEEEERWARKKEVLISSVAIFGRSIIDNYNSVPIDRFVGHFGSKL